MYRWFCELINEYVAANQWLDSEVVFRLVATMNALYEFIYDKPAPGATSQAIQGHNHNSTQGGRVVARGTVFVGGAGKNQYFLADLISSSTWYTADNNNSSTLQRGGSIGWFYASATSTGASSPYTTPVGWAYLRIMWPPSTGSHTLSARLYNRTMSKYSDTQTAVLSPGTGVNPETADMTFTEVPIQAGWNEFDLQFSSSSGSNQAVYTTTLVVVEAADVDGCYEASTGVSPLGGL